MKILQTNNVKNVMMHVLYVKVHLLINVLDAKMSVQLFITNIMDLIHVILHVHLVNILICQYQILVLHVRLNV